MSPSGYKELICEILLITWFDLRHRERKGGSNDRHRREALAFLKTAWFEYLCLSIDLNPNQVMSRLLESSVNQRHKAKNSIMEMGL